MQSNIKQKQSVSSIKTSKVQVNPNSTNNDMRDTLQQYIKNVIAAYRNQRIFSVFSTKMQATKELKSRGWLEKLLPGCRALAEDISIHTLLRNAKPGNAYELVLISKLINNFPIHFVWAPSSLYAKLNYDEKAIRNSIQRAKHIDYGTKVGLVGCAEQEHWHKDEDICEMNYPRLYRMGGTQQERKEFIDDFHRTQCRCLVQFIINKINKPFQITDKDFGTVEPKILKFALKILRHQLDDFENKSLDNDDDSSITSEAWAKFMHDSSQIINKKAQFKADISAILKYKTIGARLLKRLEKCQPDYQWDGCRNMWILKPSLQSCGVGIIVRNSLEDILKYTKQQNKQYIAQKYVERPLLIYNTKFDIRQHALLSITDTMIRIYLYKDCYFKFATREFTLEDFSERIHLTNHTVQKPYKYNMKNSKLPKNLMWSLYEFKLYLKHQPVSPNIWENKIFPGFCRNVVAVILTGLAETDFVENTFEVMGCDFMLDKDYNPILIEMNCNPDLTSSTTVTERVCAQVQSDVLKVLIDLPKNTNASIGNFNLIYELNHKINTNFQPNLDISISGKSLIPETKIN